MSTNSSDNPWESAEFGMPRSIGEMRRFFTQWMQDNAIEAPPVGSLYEDVVIDNIRGNSITAEITVPDNAGPHPVLIFLHGGGWLAGSAHETRRMACLFANAGYLVINLNYRLAPEYPFPNGLDDTLSAIEWSKQHAAKYGGDASRLVVGGDSAGATLAAGAAIALAQKNDSDSIKALLLIYGVYEFGSYSALGLRRAPAEAQHEPFAEARRIVDMQMSAYFGGDPTDTQLNNPLANPILAAENFPPSQIVIGTADPVHWQSKMLAEALANANVEHDFVEIAGMGHGAIQDTSEASSKCFDRMVSFLDGIVK